MIRLQQSGLEHKLARPFLGQSNHLAAQLNQYYLLAVCASVIVLPCCVATFHPSQAAWLCCIPLLPLSSDQKPGTCSITHPSHQQLLQKKKTVGVRSIQRRGKRQEQFTPSGRFDGRLWITNGVHKQAGSLRSGVHNGWETCKYQFMVRYLTGFPHMYIIHCLFPHK